MTEPDTCPICDSSTADFVRPPSGKDCWSVECKTCGRYTISRTLARTGFGEYANQRHLVSGVVRERYEGGAPPPELTTTSIEDLVASANPPEDLLRGLDRLLLYLSDELEGPADGKEFVPSFDYPILYCRKDTDFLAHLHKAEDLNYTDRTGNKYGIGIGGYRRLRELRKGQARPQQAFVAMSFADEMEESWRLGFEKALDNCNYNPVRIDQEEYNTKICDRIVAEIKKSGLLVADFTGQRAGVYFEAGLAMGEGIPVIWTCHEDDIEDLHFDTRQYNHIKWSTPEDLREQLVNRIEATVPLG